MNINFGKINQSHEMEFAKNSLQTSDGIILNPTKEQYLAEGWLPVVDEAPLIPVPAYHHLEYGDWTRDINGRLKWENDGWHYDATPEAQSYAEYIHKSYWIEADPMPQLADYDAAMEDHLKQEREARGYTTREPDSYLTSQVPRWAQDAKDWVKHRDDVMEYALELINAVQHGEREPPTMEEFIDGLPEIVWTYSEAV